eukprot:11095438-Karenia_brevis.AAC.1
MLGSMPGSSQEPRNMGSSPPSGDESLMKKLESVVDKAISKQAVATGLGASSRVDAGVDGDG